MESHIDLLTLPEHAQQEVYDFYLFIKNRYKIDIKSTPDEALERFLENNKKRNLYVDPSIDLTALADEVNDVEL